MAAVVETETPGGDPFAGIPAGPELAAALATTPVAQLPGQHVAAWMRATFRQRNHDDAVLLDAIRQACRSRADDCRRVLDDGFAPKIAAANLGWSAITAGARYGLALFVLDAHPALGAAMHDGVLESRKAEIFDAATEGLDDHQIDHVIRIVLPEAPGLAYQALRERILEVARALDPDWAAARLAAAVARARVTTRVSPTGAVDLTGHDLPPDLAQDAKAHLDALAAEAQTRLAFLGLDYGRGFISARLFTRLLDGTLTGYDDPAVLDAIVNELCGGGPPGSPTDDRPNPDDRPDDGPDDGGPDDGGPDDGGPDDGGPDDGGPDDGPGCPDGGSSSGDSGPDDGPDLDESPGDEGPADDDRPDSPTPDSSGGGAGPSAGGFTGNPVVEPYPEQVALRMRLSTLLGHDQHPAELPGLGGTTPEVARRRAHHLGTARWHVLVHDDHGHLHHLLTLRAPPEATRDPRHRRRTVEITAPAALLDALTSSDAHDPWLATLLAAYYRSRDLPPEDHPATTSRDTDRRLPGAALGRWIDARDPTCVAPGCSVAARRCEHDHTHDWQDTHRTHADGLANLCKADHRAKHIAGWHHEQPAPGRFTITDPTGTVHHTQSRVVRPLPDPVAPHSPHPPGLLEVYRPADEEYRYATRPARPRPEEDDSDPPF
ncbi:HNH endonuclease signature motif containing protein [Actinomycetospora termitidis]|uniref:HNH endonuclease signature motif containing protein n=1 Tax=Actinomycetospora termitidis TaxID=3053470 RepID=A0ABT7M7Q6_9PSEU|nr:HNH endonuclease signature motif containing protein [Actinomycetospora sp. Odt1-22]MDL5156700.1 HNH endonuclease signature motif containing protein [Actinomycetospora sp. Odt1-22]